MATYLPVADCTTGIGTTVQQLCGFKLGDVQMLGIIASNSDNPFTGVDSDAQLNNLTDQAVWTASQALASPNNLYVSPLIYSATFALTHDEFTSKGHMQGDTLVSKGIQEISFKMKEPAPDVAAQLEKLNGQNIKFIMITKDGGLWHKSVTDGVQYPLFSSVSPCKVSSIDKADKDFHGIELIVRAKKDWFNEIGATAAAPAPLDATGLIEVQERLVEQ